MLQNDTYYPLVEIEVQGKAITCLIDTGFTGDIALAIDTALVLGLDVTREVSFAKVAGGGAAAVKASSAYITWFNQPREVGVAVFVADRVGPVDGIIGVHLLIGYILVIDFNEGIVAIKDPSLLTALP